MRVGILTASVSRQAGGLFTSVRKLSSGISAHGSVSIFTGIDKYTVDDRPHWDPLSVMALPVTGPKSIGFTTGLADALVKANLDLLHVHGLWMYPSIASRRWARENNRPYLISPRGMLDSWALNNSQWKKRLAARLYEDAHLRGATCLHALCDAELEAIRAYGLRNPVCVIPNGIDLPDGQTGTKPCWAHLLPESAQVLLYLGRIHPKKGLINLLHAWKLARVGSSDAKGWVLVIAGWDQDGHEAELKSLATNLGISDSVFFVGPQFDRAKLTSYASADAFVLPSFSEGLPMVVLEAWAHSLPVVMTPQCNLPEGFAAQAAIKVEAETVSISAGLIALFTQADQERLAMGARGRQLVQDRFTWPRIADQMLAVYRWVLTQGPKPSCVISD